MSSLNLEVLFFFLAQFFSGGKHSQGAAGRWRGGQKENRFEVTFLLLCKIILDNKPINNNKPQRTIILLPIYQKGLPTRLAVL